MHYSIAGPDAHSVLPEQEVARRCGINPSTWRRMLSRGETPSPIRLSPRRRGYRWGDVSAWLDARTAQRGAQ